MRAEEVKVGCFQIVLALLLAVNYVIVAMSHAIPIFYNYTPKFTCPTTNSTGVSSCLENLNNSRIANSSVPCGSNSYRFNVEPGVTSVVTEWSLICDRRYLTILGPSVYYLGALIGASIAGLLADRIGRLPVQAICLYAQGTMAVALYVVQDYPMFLALRGLQGVFVQGLQNSTYILSLELFPARARTLVALLMQIAWASGLVLLSALSYVIPDWRILQLAISVPTAVTVLYIWIVPESPRWLLARGKTTEADMAIEGIVKYNGCCVRSPKDVEIENANNDVPTTPTSERNSRVTSVDLGKVKTDEKTREEATNLLSSLEPEQPKVRKSSFRTNAENFEKKLAEVNEKKEETTEEQPPEVADRELPSSSKSDENITATPVPEINEMTELKNTEETTAPPEPPERVPREDEQSKNDIKVTKRLKKEKKKIKIDNMRNLLGSSLARRYFMAMLYLWFATSMADYVLALISPTFTSDRHITFAIGGGLEIITYIFAYFVISKFGRKIPLSMYQLLNGLFCVLIAGVIFAKLSNEYIDWARTIVIILARMTVLSNTLIIFLYSVELFPTVMRGTCLGMCIIATKISSLCASHAMGLNILPEFQSEHGTLGVPLTAIGVLCLIGSFVATLLPETLNKILPDSVSDVEFISGRVKDCENANDMTDRNEELSEREILREKLFSEDWVDAGNGILVNFSENKNSE